MLPPGEDPLRRRRRDQARRQHDQRLQARITICGAEGGSAFLPDEAEHNPPRSSIPFQNRRCAERPTWAISVSQLLEELKLPHLPTYVFKAAPHLIRAPAAAPASGQAELPKGRVYVPQARLHEGLWGLDGQARHLRVLCALAILLCPALKTQIFENSTFGVYVELAPYVRELVGAHLSRTFKAVLELLNRYSWRHALDIYLAPRVTELMNMIRNWVVVPYFQPFAEDGASRRSRSGSSRSSSPTPFTSASTIRTMCLLYFILKPYMQLNTSPGRRFCTRRAPQAARRPPGRAHVADGSRIAVEGCLAARSTICAMSRSLPPRINRPSRLKDDGEDLIYLL
ncbi:hypothetical protein B0H13DRAFT_2305282 [Mycena leptocephala]|nr:hypothetical protein B0H13DRAFT_2305282 [Mycena leptocephala]